MYSEQKIKRSKRKSYSLSYFKAVPLKQSNMTRIDDLQFHGEISSQILHLAFHFNILKPVSGAWLRHYKIGQTDFSKLLSSWTMEFNWHDISFVVSVKSEGMFV